MTAPNDNEPLALRDQPMTAWENAAALGIDMSLIESNLRATPDQRLLWHDQALQTLEMIENATKSHLNRLQDKLAIPQLLAIKERQHGNHH